MKMKLQNSIYCFQPLITYTTLHKVLTDISIYSYLFCIWTQVYTFYFICVWHMHHRKSHKTYNSHLTQNKLAINRHHIPTHIHTCIQMYFILKLISFSHYSTFITITSTSSIYDITIYIYNLNYISCAYKYAKH